MRITLVKSLIGVTKKQVVTVNTLGLRKKGDSKIVKDNPSIRGMVEQVSYLLKIEG
jgi:large subunit ribosomal protein L30